MVSPTAKEPLSAKREDDAAPAKLTHDDAVQYLVTLRKAFADRPQVYNKFLEIMKEFKSKA